MATVGIFTVAAVFNLALYLMLDGVANLIVAVAFALLAVLFWYLVKRRDRYGTEAS